MVLLDTCALVFDALTPARLTARARRAIEDAEEEGRLACSDISLWEVAMLVSKGRLDPGTDCQSFLEVTLQARGIRVLPITPEIAARSVAFGPSVPRDPADRLIAATALHHRARLVTADEGFREFEEITILW
jgi:PIN domain nuclease of toxin-antitoxin system